MKNIEWLKDEILTDMRYLEGNREIQQLDIKYQTLREVAQKINSLDEPDILSQDWINKHKREHDEYPSGAPVLLVDDVKGLLVPKQELPVIPSGGGHGMSESKTFDNKLFNYAPPIKIEVSQNKSGEVLICESLHRAENTVMWLSNETALDLATWILDNVSIHK